MIDPFDAADLVRRDVEAGLGKAFEAGDGDGAGYAPVDLGPNAARPITNEAATAVAWTWTGVHRDRSDLVPYAGTGRPVVVEGVTVVTEDREGNPQFRRYVDWLGALAQIGVTLTDRPVFDVPEVLRDLQGAGDS